MTPYNIIDEYIHDLFSGGTILIELKKKIYRLPQVERFSYENFIPHVQKKNYPPSKYAHVYSTTSPKPLTVCMIVDYVGVNYTNKKDIG